MLLDLRRATPDDADDIARVHVASWRAAYRGVVPDSVLDALDPIARARQWSANIAEPVRHVALARAGGRVVGFCSSQPRRDEGLGERVAEITAIYVAPRAWGQGVGRALLAAELPRLASAGFVAVVLWVLDANARAQRFYRAAGFAADGARRLALGELAIPEHRLTRPLDGAFGSPGDADGRRGLATDGPAA